MISRLHELAARQRFIGSPPFAEPPDGTIHPLPATDPHDLLHQHPARMVHAAKNLDPDERFERGLTSLLKGMATEHAILEHKPANTVLLAPYCR